MTMRMKFFGYDCDLVDKHLQEIDQAQRKASTELMEQCMARAERNRELAEQVAAMARELEQAQNVEKMIVDRLAEQLGALQQAYLQGFALVEQKNQELGIQVQRIESTKQLLGDWQRLAGR